MLLSCLSRSTNFPSAIIARCGYVWLPIGRPSGFADAVPALASMNPAAAAPVAVFPKNSLLVIRSIGVSCVGRGLQPPRYFYFVAAAAGAGLLVKVNVP